MTNKLTAKLSDGTEWEVLSYRGQAFGKRDGISYKDETIGLELKPLKKEPREWWEVRSRESGYFIGSKCESKEKAEADASARNYSSGGNGYIVVHVREVVG